MSFVELKKGVWNCAPPTMEAVREKTKKDDSLIYYFCI